MRVYIQSLALGQDSAQSKVLAYDELRFKAQTFGLERHRNLLASVDALLGLCDHTAEKKRDRTETECRTSTRTS